MANGLIQRVTFSRVLGVLLVPLGALAAAVWSFVVFGSALWANIYVDGNDEASTLDVLADIGPFAFGFLVPGIVVVGLSRLLRLPAGRLTFGAVALVGLPIFTFGYGIGALAASAMPWAAASVIRRRRLTWPPIDLISMMAGIILIVFWCYSEAHR